MLPAHQHPGLPTDPPVQAVMLGSIFLAVFNVFPVMLGLPAALYYTFLWWDTPAAQRMRLRARRVFGKSSPDEPPPELPPE